MFPHGQVRLTRSSESYSVHRHITNIMTLDSFTAQWPICFFDPLKLFPASTLDLALVPGLVLAASAQARHLIRGPPAITGPRARYSLAVHPTGARPFRALVEGLGFGPIAVAHLAVPGIDPLGS